MLAEVYIEALLVDEELADQVWELWNVGMIPNDLVAWAWCMVANIDRTHSGFKSFDSA